MQILVALMTDLFSLISVSVDALVNTFLTLFSSLAASLSHELKRPDDNISYSDLISVWQHALFKGHVSVFVCMGVVTLLASLWQIPSQRLMEKLHLCCLGSLRVAWCAILVFGFTCGWMDESLCWECGVLTYSPGLLFLPLFGCFAQKSAGPPVFARFYALTVQIFFWNHTE